MAKSVLTEYRFELAALLTVLFAFLTLVSVLGVMYIEIGDDGEATFDLPDYISFFESFLDPLGTWVDWIAVAAPIGLIVCAWWLYDFVKKTRELSELIDTPSKAKFVRNLDDIEYLAWSLPQRFEDEVLQKKREFKL